MIEIEADVSVCTWDGRRCCHVVVSQDSRRIVVEDLRLSGIYYRNSIHLEVHVRLERIIRHIFASFHHRPTVAGEVSARGRRAFGHVAVFDRELDLRSLFEVRKDAYDVVCHENFALFPSIVNVVLVWLSAISKSWARIVTLSILTGASSASDVSSLVQDVDINADMAAMILSVIFLFMILGVLN